MPWQESSPKHVEVPIDFNSCRCGTSRNTLSHTRCGCVSTSWTATYVYLSGRDRYELPRIQPCAAALSTAGTLNQPPRRCAGCLAIITRANPRIRTSGRYAVTSNPISACHILGAVRPSQQAGHQSSIKTISPDIHGHLEPIFLYGLELTSACGRTMRTNIYTATDLSIQITAQIQMGMEDISARAARYK